jgi:hypothetical protein
MSRLVVAALVLLAAIGSLLGAARWNRGGNPQFIELTERELALPWSWENGHDDDDAEVRLSFRWQPRSEPQDARVWLTDVTLRTLGFGVGVPAGALEAAVVYGRSLPRVAWVAFEFNGPAWRLIEQRRATTDVERHFGTASGASRLVPVDAGLEPDVLRRRHAQGANVIVMPGIVHMRYTMDAARGPSVWGWVPELVSSDVSVPLHLRERLRNLKPVSASRPPADTPHGETAEWLPRYTVKLGVGRLGAAWIEEIRPLAQPD